MRTENPERNLRESTPADTIRDREAISMRSAIITGPGTVKLHSVTMPEPETDEIRVRLEGCGICASNLPIWEGRPWFEYPLEPGNPGHEGWGHIDAIGGPSGHFRVGERVSFLSSHALGEYDIAKVEAAVPLPPEFDGKPFPGEPLGCAMNIFRRSEIRTGQWVAIVGVGFLGALLVDLAAGIGARVIAVSRNRHALETARRRGAEKTILAEDTHKAIDSVKKATNGNFCDRVIEATGHEGPLNLAGEITRIRGRLIIAGFHQDGLRQINLQLWNWRGIDVINAHERETKEYVRGIKEAIRAVSENRLNFSPLLTHKYRLENISEAFEAAHKRPEGFMKAIVEF